MHAKRERRTAYAMLLPLLFVLLSLIAYPLYSSISLSLTDHRVGSTSTKFIGLQNYAELIQWSLFHDALVNSLLYVVFALTLKTILGLTLAMVIESLGKPKFIFRALILLPWVLPDAISALSWRWIFDPSYSVLNWILNRFGIESISWLGDVGWARFAIITVNIWRGVPFFALIFSAGLVTIPNELYEAADVDGARGYTKFLKITIPHMIPPFNTLLLFSMTRTVAEFNIVRVLTGGGPFNKTHLLGTLAYHIGLSGAQLGKGAAVSLFLFPVLLIATIFSIRSILKERGF